MNKHEQQLEDLKLKYDILIRAVHEMNDLIHELRDKNKKLTRIVEGTHNE